MQFQQWLSLNENVVYENEDVLIRDALPNEIPNYFIHRTEDQENINSIKQQGFDLGRWGATAKKFKTPSYITDFQPQGIYALGLDNINDEHQKYDTRPYVVFTANINKALVVIEKGQYSNAKKSLSEAMGGLSGQQLTNQLKKMGYQAVLYPGSEQIILDPKIIQIVSGS